MPSAPLRPCGIGRSLSCGGSVQRKARYALRGVFMVRFKIGRRRRGEASWPAAWRCRPRRRRTPRRSSLPGGSTTRAGQAPPLARPPSLSPVPIRGVATNVTQLAGSKGAFVLSLRSDGTVWGWGDNQVHDLGDLTGHPPLRRCRSTACRRASSRSRPAPPWRSPGRGRLRMDVGQRLPGLPCPRADSPTPHQVPGLTGVKQVAAGYDFTVALRSNGEVWTWGANYYGQLGDGTHTDRATRPQPRRVRDDPGQRGLRLRAGAAPGIGVGVGSQLRREARQRLHRGGQRHPGHRRPAHAERHADRGRLDHAFAVDPDGSLWAWGGNDYGGSAWVPPGRSGPHAAEGTRAGRRHPAGGRAEESMALRSDGTLLVWGYEDYGLRGDGIPRSATFRYPPRLPRCPG